VAANVEGQSRSRRRIAATIEVSMHFTIEHEREEDGRWLAEVPELPGVLAYGTTEKEAMAKAQALALRVLAERLEHDETGPQPISIAVA
jgi:predicted RNase H-like HicB family nuclease